MPERLITCAFSESLAAGRPRRRPASSWTTRPRTSRPTCRSSRCSTSSTRGSSRRARIRSRSTRTAARASAAPAASWSTASPHGPGSAARRSASCTCAGSRTATRSRSSRGAREAFPVIKDLVVDRSAFDRIIQAGGYTSVNVGGAPGRQRHPDSEAARRAGDGLGRVHRLRRLRRGLQERLGGALHVGQDQPSGAAAAGPGRAPARASSRWSSGTTPKGFGSCSNEGECEAVCPKEIPITNIARMNREYLKAVLL